MVEERWKNLDYIPSSTAICLLLSCVNEKKLCTQKSILLKLITIIITAGSIFRVYTLFPPEHTRRVKWYSENKNSSVTRVMGFLTVVLEKTLESPLDWKEIQPAHSEGDQPWDFFGRNDAEAETPVLWAPHAKS